MKEQLKVAIANLQGFLENIESINKHPYSKGIDTDKLLTDLKEYAKDLNAMIDKLPEENKEDGGETE